MRNSQEAAAWGLIAAVGAIAIAIWLAASALGLPFGTAAQCFASSAAVLIAGGASLLWGGEWAGTRFLNVAPLLVGFLWAAWWPALDVWDTIWSPASPLDYISSEYAIRNGAWWATGWAKWLPVVLLATWTGKRIWRDSD